jgi:hypothetical protein
MNGVTPVHHVAISGGGDGMDFLPTAMILYKEWISVDMLPVLLRNASVDVARGWGDDERRAGDGSES